MNRQDIVLLQSQEGYPALSIFARTHRTMPDREKDPIVIKNLVKEARERLLKEFSVRELEELFVRLDEVVAKIDYARSKDGIAIFVNKDIARIFRLPVPVESRVIIDKVFALGEIDKIMHQLVNYWLLQLDEKSVRLYNGIGGILYEFTDGKFPLTYEKPRIEAMQYKVDGKTFRHSPHDAQYFDQHKLHFMKEVVDAYQDETKKMHLPLIVTGIERNISFFKEAFKNPIAAEVLGSFEEFSIYELADVIEPAVQKLWEEKQARKMQEFIDAVGKLNHAFGIRIVWRMVEEGRVRDLLVEEGYSVPGAINEGDPSNIMLAEDSTLPGISDDLVDLLIAKVVEKGGSVTFFAPGALSEYEKIAAILRF